MPETDADTTLTPGRRMAALRTADAMIRALGGRRVTLRIADPSLGDTNSQLGITPPTSEDIKIAPGMVQSMPPDADGTRRWQVVLSAKALRAAAEQYGVTNLSDWLTHSQGVVFRGRLLHIRSVLSHSFADGDYMYFAIATE